MRVNKEKLKKYAPEKGIKFIILFGSQATGNVLEESDFDLAVLTTKEKSISTLR